MATGAKMAELGLQHQGEKYQFGALVPKNYKDYTGPWDCAEFASWLVYQVSGRLYGCANNDGDPAGADAYSGFWGRDAEKIGKKISVQEAQRTHGAIVVRLAAKGIIGHVVVSLGDGRTVEAHSTKTGVIVSNFQGRRWDFGVLVPWLTYTQWAQPLPPIKKPGKIYRYTTPMMNGPVVISIQKALGVKADGWFGPKTFAAVRLFQVNAGLVADGEVGPQTAAKLGLTL
jgi:N-acetylmuramoyl-L-alanine amidase